MTRPEGMAFSSKICWTRQDRIERTIGGTVVDYLSSATVSFYLKNERCYDKMLKNKE